LAKLADNSVNSAKIVDASISNDDIADRTIDGAKLVASIALAGSPTTTTQPAGTADTKIATTAFVADAVAGSTSGFGIYLGSVVATGTCPAGTQYALGDYKNGKLSNGSPVLMACFK
jgi:hypothetical protein